MRVKALLFGLLLSSGLALCGCQSASNRTNLLSLTGCSPTDLDLGDEFEISGNGFPEGKAARVAFRGDLYRAGSKVRRDVEIVARTSSSSPRSLSLSMTEELRQAFTGSEDDAKHTTFRGDVEVSFTPKKSGSAPVMGVISDVVLDVLPPLVSPTLQQQRDKSADEALSFLGLELREGDAGSCCVVAGSTSRAAAVGILPGDRLIDLDGVTVKSKWDLVPSSSRRTSRLGFRHADAGRTVVREIDVQGYRSTLPSELGPAIAFVGFAVVMLLLHATKLGQPLEWLVRWLSQRLREQHTFQPGARRKQFSSRLRVGSDWLGLPEEPAFHLLSILILVALTALSMAVALRVELVSRELDLLLWCLAQTISVVWAAMLFTVAEPERRLRSVLRATGTVFLLQLPILSLAAISVVSTQSLRIFDLVDAQDTTLLGYNAFRSPAQLLLTGLSLFALLPAVSLQKSRQVSTTDDNSPKPKALGLLLRGLGSVLLGTLHLWSTALLLTLLAFGGYRIPGIGSATQAGLISWQCLGVFILLLKATGLVLVVKGLRFVAGEFEFRDSLSLGLRPVMGLLGTAVLLAGTWGYLARRFSLGWLVDSMAWVLLLSTLASLGLVVYRAVQKARKPNRELLPNPWI